MPAKKNGPASDDGPLFENVMKQFEDCFRTKRLRPGSKLPPERELAAEFGVSRHTLREVLKALNLFGIIRSRAGDGTYVQRSLSGLVVKAIHLSILLEDVDYMDAYNTRLAIEPTLARIAASNARREHIEMMRREIHGMESNLGKVEEYTRHEVAFHGLIVTAADNPILKSVMTAVADLLLEARLTITYERVERDDLMLHVRILEAIETRDPEAAFAAMAHHLAVNRKYYDAYFKKKTRETDAQDSLAGREARVVTG